VSEENVEIARQAIEAWNDGDMDTLRDLYDSGAVYRNPSDWIDAGPFFGRDAIMQQFSELRDVWADESSFDNIDILDAGDRVVVQVDFRADTRGLPLTVDMAWVYTMRNGLIVSLEIFHSREEALKALELSN
jgi:ketosteroid isomerase-like protein